MEGPRNTKKRYAAKEVPETESSCQSVNHSVTLNTNSVANNEEEKSDEESGNEISINLFKVEHSKTGTAKCVECEKKIDQGSLRIGKMVPYKQKHITRFYHVPCAFLAMRRARIASNIIEDISQLDGIDAVSPDERNQIIKLIEDDKASRATPLPTRCAGKEKPKPQPISKTRKSRLVPSKRE